MQFLLKSSSGNYLATTAIGGHYFDQWYKHAFKNWEVYCKKHQIGIIVVQDDLIAKNDSCHKNGCWQRYLIADHIIKNSYEVNNICQIDTDFLISPLAPNVFESYDQSKFGVVSQEKNMPYPDLHRVKRQIAYGRHYFYDEKYPLDSSLFLPLEELWRLFGFPNYDDYFCAGFLLYNVSCHGEFLKNFYYKYLSNENQLGNWDEAQLNHELQASGNIQWLSYKYQAIWVYEMAYKYPFLYEIGKTNPKLVQKCIEASLFENYFLHFAGSWHESSMWTEVEVFNRGVLADCQRFQRYLETPITGKPVGRVKP